MCIKIEKKTTHVKVDEEDIHHHIKKISTIYVNMVIRPVYKKKEVSTLPNKIKHISHLQRHIFLPLTCRILKRNHITIFPPFRHDWQKVEEARTLHPRNIKKIKGLQRIHINAWIWWNKMLWMTRYQKDAKHVKNNAFKRILIDRSVTRCRARCWGFGHWQIQVSSKCWGTKTSDTRDKAQSIH